MWELAHADLALMAFRERRIALRFIKARTEVLFGRTEAIDLGTQTLSRVGPGEFGSQPLFWRFCLWQRDEDSIDAQIQACEIACSNPEISTQEAIVSAFGRAIERWSKGLKKKMHHARELQLFHPELLSSSPEETDPVVGSVVNEEPLLILRLAYVRELSEWKRFHEALPGQFMENTGLRTNPAVGEKVCVARPPRSGRTISRSSPINEKGIRILRQWLTLSLRQARFLACEAKENFLALMKKAGAE